MMINTLTAVPISQLRYMLIHLTTGICSLNTKFEMIKGMVSGDNYEAKGRGTR